VNNRQNANQVWVGKCEFPGKKPFLLGNVVLPYGSMDHEVQTALKALWDDIIPYPGPDYIRPIPGAIFFTGT